MHFKVEREIFLNNLELVGRVSTKHVTLPVLQCVLIEAKGNILTLKSTNLEIGVEAVMAASVEVDGVIAVPTSTLLQTIQYMSGRDVELQLEDSTLVVESSGSKTSIKSIPHEEFPKIPRIDGKGQSIEAHLFALGIKTASFAASVSSIKPELGSVYVSQKKEHSLTCVATDSFRLMEKTVPQKNFILDEPILIPHKNALELARVCELKGGSPQIKINENQCAIEFDDGVYITSRLTSGSFPDYQQIIPKEYSTHVTLLKSDLVNAFKKSNIFLNKFLQVGLLISKNNLTVSANSGDVGATTESIRAETEGEDITLNFNQRYVAECLQYISDESITLHFAGIGRPLVINGVNDNTLRYLVMPMNK